MVKTSPCMTQWKSNKLQQHLARQSYLNPNPWNDVTAYCKSQTWRYKRSVFSSLSVVSKTSPHTNFSPRLEEPLSAHPDAVFSSFPCERSLYSSQWKRSEEWCCCWWSSWFRLQWGTSSLPFLFPKEMAEGNKMENWRALPAVNRRH